MRKIIEATKDNKEDEKDKKMKALAGLTVLSVADKQAQKKAQKKLMNDIMYYLRKLLNLAKQVQGISESAEIDVEKNAEDFEKIKQKIDELEKQLKEN